MKQNNRTTLFAALISGIRKNLDPQTALENAYNLGAAVAAQKGATTPLHKF